MSRRAPIALALFALAWVGCKGAPARCPGGASGKGASAAASAEVSLRFIDAKGKTRRMPRSEMQRIAPARVLKLRDPNYKALKRYRAHELVPLLSRGLGVPRAKLRAMKVLFIATDGYKVSIPGAYLLDADPQLAVADAEHPQWQTIPGHDSVKPGPLYVVWRAKVAQDMKRYPWPWQLATIKPSPADLYARTVPTSAPAGSAARAGHEIFLRDCIRCHAINRQGGRLGPELNVPKNVLEYREEKLLRAFIRNPFSFRYGAMPPQAQLSPKDLDNVLAYLRLMAKHKHDPAAPSGTSGAGAAGANSERRHEPSSANAVVPAAGRQRPANR